MEIFKRLSKKGYKPYYEGTVEELDSMSKDNQHLHSEIIRVIMWLYENHGVWICVDWMSRTKPFNSGFISHLRGVNKYVNSDNFIVINNTKLKGYEVFDSPTEAYEAAIEYCVKNLI